MGVVLDNRDASDTAGAAPCPHMRPCVLCPAFRKFPSPCSVAQCAGAPREFNTETLWQPRRRVCGGPLECSSQRRDGSPAAVQPQRHGCATASPIRPTCRQPIMGRLRRVCLSGRCTCAGVAHSQLGRRHGVCAGRACHILYAWPSPLTGFLCRASGALDSTTAAGK